MPDTDGNSKVDAEEVKCKQETAIQAVMREKHETEKKLKDIYEQSKNKTEESEYQ